MLHPFRGGVPLPSTVYFAESHFAVWRLKLVSRSGRTEDHSSLSDESWFGVKWFSCPHLQNIKKIPVQRIALVQLIGCVCVVFPLSTPTPNIMGSCSLSSPTDLRCLICDPLSLDGLGGIGMGLGPGGLPIDANHLNKGLGMGNLGPGGE